MYSLLKESEHNKIINKFHKTYLKYLNQLKKISEIQASNQSEISAIVKLMKEPSLKSYAPLNLYWLKLVEKLFYVQELIAAWADNFDEQDEIESEIFSFWNDSEFALHFSQYLRNHSLIGSATKTYSIYYQQIISFYHLHIQKAYRGKDALIYKPIPEMGEQMKLFDNKLKGSFLEIKKIFKNVIDLEDNKQLNWPNWQHKIEIYQTSIVMNLIPGSLKIKKDLPKLKTSIENALSIIAHANIDLINIFRRYSHTLVLVDVPGIVSYSSQDLPGYSTINVVDRDSIDLMDDLLHENGHHILNRILDTTNLIYEDDFKIFYSPWRRSLRPIRGIYHAYLTFFWAFILFTELSKKIDFFKAEGVVKFTNKQTVKIYFRAIEEYEMLKYSFHDIKVAFKLGKVTKTGYELAIKTHANLMNQDSYIKKLALKLKNLDQRQFSKISKLRNELRKHKAHYKIKA